MMKMNKCISKVVIRQRESFLGPVVGVAVLSPQPRPPPRSLLVMTCAKSDTCAIGSLAAAVITANNENHRSCINATTTGTTTTTTRHAFLKSLHLTSHSKPFIIRKRVEGSVSHFHTANKWEKRRSALSSLDKFGILQRYFCTKEETLISTEKMNQLNQAKNIWRKAEAICFDVDSTVIQDEAIDELAKFCGKGDEVEQLTREAMKGGMDFRQALALRLDLIRPSLQQLRNYILSSKQRLSPYVKELIHELHKRGKEVYLISGGFRSIIIPLAQEMHIPTANVYANKLKFYYDGEYAGFDENQCTSRTGGKGQVIRNLKEKHGYETVVMIGDGITDWEASPPADLFIGFGGNAYRQEVKSKSKWYVTDFRDLINELRD